MITLSLVFALLIGQQFKTDAEGAIISNGDWHLPATIEALRDVNVELSDYRKPERRGVLYVAGRNETPFHIRKGDRFEMMRPYPESPSCRIRFEGKAHEVATCYWIDGVIDRQTDVYRVISGHIDQNKKK